MGITQINVLNFVLGAGRIDLQQHPDATTQTTGNGHLGNIEQGYLGPAMQTYTRNLRRKDCIEVLGRREDRAANSFRFESVALAQHGE